MGKKINIWNQNHKGNWVKFIQHVGVVTVFFSENDDNFKWVNDGNFSEEFSSAEEAMEDFDEKYDL